MHGGWKYLYRGIDRDGALVDVMLSEHRNLAAAKHFVRSAKAVTGVILDRITTDGHDAYPRAIRTELGSRVAWKPVVEKPEELLRPLGNTVMEFIAEAGLAKRRATSFKRARS